MDLLNAMTDEVELQTLPFCEMCGFVQSPADNGWHHQLDSVEEVEVSWANGDQGLVRHLATRSSYDLCPTCAIHLRDTVPD
jgi:hypothetical protein